MAQENTKLCDFSSTNKNDFISTAIAPATSAESYEINAALLNLVTKDQFFGLPSEDAASHLNNFVELCDMQKKKDVDNDIVNFKQLDHEHVAQSWERMKLMIRNCPTHGLNLWMIIQKNYAGLNFASRNLLDSTAGVLLWKLF